MDLDIQAKVNRQKGTKTTEQKPQAKKGCRETVTA